MVSISHTNFISGCVSLMDSTFNIPPLLSNFFELEFDIGEFYVIHYSILHDIAINNYYNNTSDEDKFLDIIEMLRVYGNKDLTIQHDQCPPSRQKYIVKKLNSLLLNYYYTEYSQNSKLKERHHKNLLDGLERCVLLRDPRTFLFLV